MNKYTVYYKRISPTLYVSPTGKNADDDVQRTRVEAGNRAGAVTQTKQQQKLFMSKEIKIISVIEEDPDNE
jgi:hypothetical protein